MEFQTIQVALDQRSVLTVSLNRPEVRNAFNEGVIEELTQVFSIRARQPGIRAVVLRGEGSVFCGGRSQLVEEGRKLQLRGKSSRYPESGSIVRFDERVSEASGWGYSWRGYRRRSWARECLRYCLGNTRYALRFE